MPTKTGDGRHGHGPPGQRKRQPSQSSESMHHSQATAQTPSSSTTTTAPSTTTTAPSTTTNDALQSQQRASRSATASQRHLFPQQSVTLAVPPPPTTTTTMTTTSKREQRQRRGKAQLQQLQPHPAQVAVLQDKASISTTTTKAAAQKQLADVKPTAWKRQKESKVQHDLSHGGSDGVSNSAGVTRGLGLHDLARPQTLSPLSTTAKEQEKRLLEGRKKSGSISGARPSSLSTPSSPHLTTGGPPATTPQSASASAASEHDDHHAAFTKQLTRVAAMDLAHLRSELQEHRLNAAGSKPVLRQRLKHYYETHLKHAMLDPHHHHAPHQPHQQQQQQQQHKHGHGHSPGHSHRAGSSLSELSFVLVVDFCTTHDASVAPKAIENIESMHIILFSLDSSLIEDDITLDASPECWRDELVRFEEWLDMNCLSSTPDPESTDPWTKWCWAVHGSQLISGGIDHLFASDQSEEKLERKPYLQWWFDLGDQFARSPYLFFTEQFYKSPHSSVATMLQNLGRCEGHYKDDRKGAWHLVEVLKILLEDGWRPETSKLCEWTPHAAQPGADASHSLHLSTKDKGTGALDPSPPSAIEE